MKARAFTLIELLVTLTIVAVLAALIFSGLQNAREDAAATQCIQNLRTLSSANIAYAGEHGGRFCHAMEKSNNVRWHGVRETQEADFDPTKGPLAPYLGRDGRVKICPSFQRMIKGKGSFENGSGGYGYNAIYIGGSPANKWHGESTANVPNPSQTVMFADCALSRPGGVQEYPFCEPWEWVRPNGRLSGPLSPSTHFRHRGKANVAWCDGHVTAETHSKIGARNYYGGDDAEARIGWFGPSENNGWWNPEYKLKP